MANTSPSRQSDAMCERSPVKSGYRLELVYRLHCTGGTVGYAGAETEGRAKLCRLITSWVTAYVLDEEVKLLVYRLRHPTTAELCYSALEGCDREIVQNLEKACSDAGSCLYLAHLEKKVLGTCNKGDWQYYQRLHPDKTYDDFSDELDEKQELQEVTEESITLTKVVNLNGTAVMQDIRIGEQEIIQKGLFERNPDEEYYKFSSATHHYRETVIFFTTAKLFFC